MHKCSVCVCVFVHTEREHPVHSLPTGEAGRVTPGDQYPHKATRSHPGQADKLHVGGPPY